MYFIPLGESSSHHLSVSIDNSLKQIHNNSKKILQIKFQSKSLDDLRLHRECQRQQTDDNYVSNTTRTEMDLSTIGCNMNIDIDEKQLYDDNKHDLREQKSQSAPVSPTKIDDKELATFIQCEQKLITDSFVYNMDLSNVNDITRQPRARTAIFFVC
ncbi:unnamed protein product [Rotaria sp. Silwood2]|nr:unnamed protein product [Rotaria sp. Silwood2]CAF2839428.1 unnamed protein product [Rotaria sp. Silwood2]CAF3031949.1 unnamed protein product [Rotaria sp. Silwood2]CAF3206227.1 unnamed protein product [Rotaria sp. Silwood2]CAF4038679.1 unnamed protein product [Rotaria sp. Silwood2]